MIAFRHEKNRNKGRSSEYRNSENKHEIFKRRNGIKIEFVYWRVYIWKKKISKTCFTLDIRDAVNIIVCIAKTAAEKCAYIFSEVGFCFGRDPTQNMWMLCIVYVKRDFLGDFFISSMANGGHSRFPLVFFLLSLRIFFFDGRKTWTPPQRYDILTRSGLGFFRREFKKIQKDYLRKKRAYDPIYLAERTQSIRP